MVELMCGMDFQRKIKILQHSNVICGSEIQIIYDPRC